MIVRPNANDGLGGLLIATRLAAVSVRDVLDVLYVDELNCGVNCWRTEFGYQSRLQNHVNFK